MPATKKKAKKKAKTKKKARKKAAPKKPDKRAARVHINARIDVNDDKALNGLVAQLGGDPFKKSTVIRAALKRGLQGLLRNPKPAAVLRAAAIDLGA